ncbi:MAG TPA: HNH endonuclease signature motif containing protein [Thermoanaerobaculia bacterium]|nr:HNH endonuclease signature motif containing protein [Thermoanaerobaculia bacterium]
MRGFVANTDHDELSFLRAIEPPVEEINFWRAGSGSRFRALQPGEPILFKLKAPHDAIAGFGWFAHFSILPLSIAWRIYETANGSPSRITMRERLLSIRGRFGMEVDPKKDFDIGCILVSQPFFFDQQDWVRAPRDFARNIVQGKVYDLTRGEGRRLWRDCLERASSQRRIDARDLIADGVSPSHLLPGGHGSPALIRSRLGARSFRIAVLDGYGRRCAVTGEGALPALEAARIREYRGVQEHSVNNGILFRADIQRLFEAGYVTVTPEYRFAVSGALSEKDDGGEYSRLHGTAIHLPENPAYRPLLEALWWHNEERFPG